MEVSIVAEMTQYHRQVNSWAVVGKFLNKSSAYAFRVARGDLKLSEDAAEAWIRNYRKQHAGKVSVPVCPTCGVAHVVGDCEGKSGVPVMGHVPLHPRRKREKRTRREMTAAQSAVWDALTPAQRDELLGIAKETPG